MDGVCGQVPDRFVAGPVGIPCRRAARDAVISMSLMDTFRAKHGWATPAAGVALVAGLSVLAVSLLGVAGRDAARTPATSNSPAASPAHSDRFVKSFLLGCDGDHSLDGATITEEATGGHANYTVNLRLASGVEQSVVVVGPPGGLQIEMHDMTGDHVPNDVILRPVLFSLLPTVLVNDGHDHFAVVVSGADPDNFSSSEDLGSRRRNGQTFVFLRSSGFRTIHLSESKRMLVPRLRQCIFSPFAQSVASGAHCTSATDRAPPSAASI
jgi:hypothetical protein